MADRVRRRPPPLATGPNALVSSAAILNPDDRAQTPKHADWMEKAWGFYDCASADTEILTLDGWRTHDQLDVGDLVLTYDPDTDSSGWEPVEAVKRYTVADEPMAQIRNRDHSSLTTWHHRWPVRRWRYAVQNGRSGRRGRKPAWTTSAEFYDSDQLITAARYREAPDEPKWSDAFVELVAWFWTEGTIRRNRRSQRVTIFQSERANPDYAASIRSALTELFGPARQEHGGRTAAPPFWNEHEINGISRFRLSVAASASLLDVAPDKVVSPTFVRSLTRAQLELFIRTSMIADGMSARSIRQKRPEMLEPLALAAILSGRTPSWGSARWGQHLHLHDKRTVCVLPNLGQVTDTRYTGTIWCPVTKSKTWMARKDGKVYFTGNTVPELRFAAQRAGHALSRCRLFAARRPALPGDEPEPVPDGHPAADLLDALGGGVAGQSQLLSSFGVHLTIPGVSYLTGQQQSDAFASWQVLSADELRNASGRYEVRRDEQTWAPCPDGTLVVKIWRPHERYHFLPDSPTRAVLPVLNELQGLTFRIDAEITSRLAGAGIFIVPSEVTFAIPDAAHANSPDPFTAQLQQAIRTAIANRSSPEAREPIVLKVPGQHVDKFKFMTFSVPLDDKAAELRREAVRRFATGMDMPAQVIEGMGDVKYWNAQFIGEDEIKLHVAPNMETICAGLTLGYMQPGLEALRSPDPEIIVWYDTSELNVRPDKSQTTMEAYDRMEVSGVALRREIGLDESDAPTPTELSTMAAVKMLTSPLTAAMVAERFGIVVTAAPTGTGQPAAAPDEPAGSTQAPPSPGPDAPPSPNGNGALAASAAAVLLPLVAAADGLVCRALERAGNRVRQRVKPAKDADNDCPPLFMHECVGGVSACGFAPAELLQHAWERVDELAPRFGVDADWLRDELEGYTADLLATGAPHTWEHLEQRLVGAAVP